MTLYTYNGSTVTSFETADERSMVLGVEFDIGRVSHEEIVIYVVDASDALCC